MLMYADIDECEKLKPCSHRCVNTLGSFRCSCPSGMSLSSDGRVCKGASFIRAFFARYNVLQTLSFIRNQLVSGLQTYMYIRVILHCSLAPCAAGAPLFPLSIYFLIFSPFYFSFSFIGFTYFLLLSIPSLSTRIVPLRF